MRLTANRRRRLTTVLLMLALPFAAACGDDDGAAVREIGDGGDASSASASGSVATAGECEIVGGVEEEDDSELHVTLDEWSIEAEEDGAEAGNVKIEATNAGEVDHEVVVVRGAKVADLTITDEGLDEDVLPDGAEVLGEIEGFPGGEECQGTFELTTGDYALVCNIVDEDDGPHADLGMVLDLTVS